MAVKECCCDELPPFKKSIFGLRKGNKILYLLLVISCLHVVGAEFEPTCLKAKNIFEKSKMLSAANIQEQPNSDADELCSSKGCCGASARARFTQLARTQLEGSLQNELGKLADVLANRAKKVNDFFKKLLHMSRKEFHTMFKRTYGMIYEQHSYVFEKLFEELERYYTQGDVEFDVMMDKFFGILYQKMFTVLNSQYSFDEKYLSCVNEHMREIRPFDDVPQKLSVQLRRAFVATRTFHKALQAGAAVVRNMMQVGVTSECVTAWARMRFCGGCIGEEAAPCSRYCHNVVRGCLPAHADLGDHWDAYVEAADKVADRLLGPFNIAMVVEPIDIKISEAIMSFQEHNQEISQKIFAGCGKPVLGGAGAAGAGPFFAPPRTRRSAANGDVVDDPHWSPEQNEVDDFEIETSFETVVDGGPSMPWLRTPQGIKKAAQRLAEQAELREKFLQYMRGAIALDEYERHAARRRDRRDADPGPGPEPGPAPRPGPGPDPASASSEIDYRAFDFDGKRGGKKRRPMTDEDDVHGGGGGGGGGGSEWGGAALEKLVREVRGRLRGARRFWGELPALLCAARSVTAAPCFNGSAVHSYGGGAAGGGSAALAANPEVGGAALAAGAAAARRLQDQLRALAAWLRDAYNGLEVRWPDPAPAPAPAGGGWGEAAQARLAFSEGSGSGSGDREGDDEDDYDYSAPGSGHIPPDFDETSDTEDRTQEAVPRLEAPEAPEAPEPPLVPAVVGGPAPNNVDVRSRSEPTRPELDPASVDTSGETERAQATPAEPLPGSASRPSLQRALFTYALPVVCAWFGSIVTDLF